MQFRLPAFNLSLPVQVSMLHLSIRSQICHSPERPQLEYLLVFETELQQSCLVPLV